MGEGERRIGAAIRFDRSTYQLLKAFWDEVGFADQHAAHTQQKKQAIDDDVESERQKMPCPWKQPLERIWEAAWVHVFLKDVNDRCTE